MILEDLLHDRDCCLFMLLHHDDNIMDGEGYDTFRPEGFQDIHKKVGLFAEQLHTNASGHQREDHGVLLR